MSSTDSDQVDLFLAALRSDVVPMPEPTRARVGERLAKLTLISPVPQPSLPLQAAAAPAWHQTPRVLLAVPIALVVGAAGQAWLSAGRATTPAVVASAQPATVASAPTIVAPPSAAVAAPAADERTAPAVPAPAVSTASRPATLAPLSSNRLSANDDLALLERARSAFATGDTPGTLQLLRQHQQRFPSSMLQQEREALTIRALVAAGRRSEAKRRAEAFAKSYPRSALRGSVERAVGNFE
jgi:hypothetical protein